MKATIHAKSKKQKPKTIFQWYTDLLAMDVVKALFNIEKRFTAKLVSFKTVPQCRSYKSSHPYSDKPLQISILSKTLTYYNNVHWDIAADSVWGRNWYDVAHFHYD